MGSDDIKVNTDDLRGKAKPAVEDSRKALNEASTSMSKISVPTDFYYCLKFNSIKNEISNTYIKLGNISNKITEIANKFEDTGSRSLGIISMLLGELGRNLGLDIGGLNHNKEKAINTGTSGDKGVKSIISEIFEVAKALKESMEKTNAKLAENGKNNTDNDSKIRKIKVLGEGGKKDAVEMANESSNKYLINEDNTVANQEELEIQMYNQDLENLTSTKENFVKYEMDEFGATEIEATELFEATNTLANVFEYNYRHTGRYGVDQGLFQKIDFSDSEVQKELEYLKNKYNMDDENFNRLITGVDNVIGVCSYATFANNLVSKYRDKPEKFEEIYGFPLYKKTDEGLVINDTELLLDIYIYANSKENGGTLFETKEDGKLYIDMSKYTDTNGGGFTEQQYLFLRDDNEKEDLINNYIENKNSNISCNIEFIYDGKANMKEFRQQLQGDIDKYGQENKKCNILIDTTEDFDLLVKMEPNSDSMIPYGNSFPFEVLEVDPNGLIVKAPDDGKYIIFFEDLQCSEEISFSYTGRDNMQESENKTYNLDNIEMNEGEIKNIMDQAKEQLENGKLLNIAIYNEENITMKNMETNKWLVLDESHSMAILDVNEDGLIVSSWGEKWLIPAEDFEYGKYDFTIKQVSISD